MIARCAHVVARRKFFDDFDIGDESRARECPFEQIVTEQRALRHAIRQRRLERIDVVDAFAGVRAFAEQILIDVGDGRAVRIDARHAGEDALEQRAFATDGQRRRHSRLQYGVAFDDAARGRVEARMIERMRELADQASHGFSRQACICIERDDVANIRRNGQRAPVSMNVVSRCATQQLIQLMQFAALALPAHPLLLPFAPDTAAMQHIETLALRGSAVHAIETGDAVDRDLQQRGIVGSVLASARRSSPRAAQNAARRRMRRGSAPRVARVGLRCASRVVSSVGTTTMVLMLAGTPSRSARPGSIVAPNPRVTARFTSATAKSIAGIRPSSAHTTRYVSRVPSCRQGSERHRKDDRSDGEYRRQCSRGVRESRRSALSQ